MVAEVSIGLWEFVTIFVLVFSLFLLIVGIFTAYFGTGKSRAIGGGLLAGGIVLGILWIFLVIKDYIKMHALTAVILNSALVLIAAVLGAIAAIGLFLIAIMKS